MEAVIKSYLGLFFLTLMFTIGLSIVNAQSNAENARDFRTQACIQLEDSNYKADVVNALMGQAEANGYELKINLRSEDNIIYKISKSNVATDENTKNIEGAVLELKYYYSLPIFASKTEHLLYGLAR